MKRISAHTDIQTLHLYPSLKHCPHCSSPLSERYRKRRLILQLHGPLPVVSHFLTCPSTTCSLHSATYRPEEEDTLALRGYHFGLDVIAYIGQLRFTEHLSITDIAQRLSSLPQFSISIKEVALLCEVFLALVNTVASHDQAYLEQLRSLGQIILSIDGVQPEKRNETLYILREVQTGRVLVARNLASSSGPEIEKLIGEVLALGIPVKGVISDKQESIRKACERQLPGVPHQLCHFHYLRDMAQPGSRADRGLKKGLRQRLRRIREIEQSADRGSAREAEEAKGYCVAIREVMRDDGQYPLNRPGVAWYERLSEIKSSIKRARGAEESKLLSRVEKRLEVLGEYRSEYTQVSKACEQIRQVAQLLNEAEEKKDPQAELREQSKHINRMRSLPVEWRDQMAKVTTSFAPHLFAYLEEPALPRTNNDLEVFIGQMKKARRQATGRKNTQEYILREGQYVAVLYGIDGSRNWVEEFARVDREEFKRKLRELRRSTERSKCWQIRRDLKGYLEDLEGRWRSLE